MDSPRIDPTDPVFTQSEPTGEQDLQTLESGFHQAQEHFPFFMDVFVTAQIRQDLIEMADIRFRDLFTPTREALVTAAEQYDAEHPEAERHTSHGESALPNWEAVIGLELDDRYLVTDDTAAEMTRQAGTPQQAVNMVGRRSPVIEDASLVALYHSYHPRDRECEIVCSHLTDDLLSYDYCIFIREPDLRDFNAPPLYALKTPTYRDFLIEMVEAKAFSLYEADQTHDVRHVFEGYAAPLVYTVDDFQRVHDNAEL